MILDTGFFKKFSLGLSMKKHLKGKWESYGTRL